MTSKEIPTCVLCLGPEGSGKTLLLRRLKTPGLEEDQLDTTTVETVGTNIISIIRKIPGKNDEPLRGNKGLIGIRELGGSMAALWPSYYTEAKVILYVIDSSNPFQISICACLLMDILSHEKLLGKKFLIILTKKDLTDRKRMNHLKFILRLENLANSIGQKGRITIIEVSSTNGENIENVRQWINANLPRVIKPPAQVSVTI